VHHQEVKVMVRRIIREDLGMGRPAVLVALVVLVDLNH